MVDRDTAIRLIRTGHSCTFFRIPHAEVMGFIAELSLLILSTQRIIACHICHDSACPLMDDETLELTACLCETVNVRVQTQGGPD